MRVVRIDGWIDIAELSIVLISIISVPFGEVQTFQNGRATGRLFRLLEVGCFGGNAVASCVLAAVSVSGGNLFHIYFGGFTLALLHPLNQVILLQFGQQTDSFVVPAGKGGLDFFQGEVDEGAALRVLPAVLMGQAHTIQHKAVQQFGIGGEGAKPLVPYQNARDAEEAEIGGFSVVEVTRVRIV